MPTVLFAHAKKGLVSTVADVGSLGVPKIPEHSPTESPITNKIVQTRQLQPLRSYYNISCMHSSFASAAADPSCLQSQQHLLEKARSASYCYSC
jgi:hypothetical protein